MFDLIPSVLDKLIIAELAIDYLSLHNAIEFSIVCYVVLLEMHVSLYLCH